MKKTLFPNIYNSEKTVRCTNKTSERLGLLEMAHLVWTAGATTHPESRLHPGGRPAAAGEARVNESHVSLDSHRGTSTTG